jgi:uncharacterized phiE125 gp8 family phage protein
MRPVLITPPSAAPVTIEAARAHLRVDHADDDALIEGLVAAAVSHLDGWTGVLGRCLEAQTWELALDRFPAREVGLPLGPVVSVTSIKYDGPDGTERTVDPAGYVVDGRPLEGWVIPVAGFAWPATIDAVNAVRVRWVAGNGCPAAVRQAILLLVGHWYERREAAGETAAEIPFGVRSLIAPFRRVRI